MSFKKTNSSEGQDTTQVVEEYILMIHALSLSRDRPLKAVTLVEYIGSSPSTVHSTLVRMQRDEYITIGDKKEICLTPKGLEKCNQLARRHRLTEVFLYETLEIPWHEVHEHAHKLEHAITPLVQERLDEFLNYPQCCPHGSPMPNSTIYDDITLIPLNTVAVDTQVKIMMVSEIIEEDKELMSFLYERRVIPKSIHIVRENIAITNTVILEGDANQRASLPYDIATQISVSPL